MVDVVRDMVDDEDAHVEILALQVYMQAHTTEK